MKKILLFLLPTVAAIGIASCSTDEIGKWSASQGYAWFSEKNVDFTFKKAPDVVVGEATLVGIPFTVAASLSDKDRTLNVEVTKAPSDNRTKYELQTPVVLRANHTMDTLWVKVWNEEHLNTVHDTIGIKLVASDSFLPGLEDKQNVNLCLYNGFARPSWWNNDAQWYIGIFDQTKMGIYYAVFGNDDDPRGEKGTWYSNIAVTYAIQLLNDYVTDNGILYLDDDPNHPGEAPYFGYVW